MSFRVIKPFNSTNRRFKVGDEIADNEDLGALTLEGAKAAGLIIPVPQASAPKAPAKGDDE